MKIIKKIGFITGLLLLFSCGNDSEVDEIVPPTVVDKKVKITNYSQNYGYSGDIVTIVGENFPDVSKTKVLFDDIEAKVESVSSDGKTLKIVLPKIPGGSFPSLKFVFADRNETVNTVENGYQQKIGVIEKEIGKWVETKGPNGDVYSLGHRSQIIGDNLFYSHYASKYVYFSDNNGLTWNRWVGSAWPGSFNVTSKLDGWAANGSELLKVDKGGTYPSLKKIVDLKDYGANDLTVVTSDDEMKNGIVVSLNRKVLKTKDGVNFTTVYDDSDASENTLDLQTSPYVKDLNHIWAAGYLARQKLGLIIYCNGNNEKWSKYVFSNYPNSMVHLVEFPSNTIGYTIVADNTSLEKKLFKSKDGGASWNVMNIGFTLNGKTTVHFKDENVGWLTDNQDVYKTENGGQTWTKFYTAPVKILKLQYSNNVLFAFGENQRLFRYYF